MVSDNKLIERQKNDGAVFPEAETAAPYALHFGDPQKEYQAACDKAAVFDVSDRTQIEITGNDRAKFLNNFCTNEILELQPGQGCEAFITNVKGRILGHVFVFVAPHSLWLETVPGAEETLIPHLDRYLIMEAAELHGRTEDCAELFVTGPQAAQLLESLPAKVDLLSTYDHEAVEGLDHPLFIRRVDWFRQPGYLLSVPRENLTDLWNKLTAGEFQPAGSQAFHALRIEAGLPLYGTDITDANLGQEAARTQQAISFTKGCYLGQEPIARIDAMGHVNRELRGLKLESQTIPQPDASITDSESGKEIGRVTSAAYSFGENAPVALGYLRSQYVKPGTTVSIQVDDQTATATVFWLE